MCVGQRCASRAVLLIHNNEDMILINLLWADDLLLVSDTLSGMQKRFCGDNHVIDNDIKTELTIVGSYSGETNLTF